MNKILSFLVVLVLSFSCVFALPYNFEDTEYVNIRLSPLEEISTSNEIYEGQEVKFKVRRNVYCHDTLLIKKDTIVTARIETIITRGMNGFPAEIIIDNFKFEGVHDTQILSTYREVGSNFALLVYPIKWALTPIPFVGSLTNLILGGNAKIKKDEVITLKYYPHWK